MAENAVAQDAHESLEKLIRALPPRTGKSVLPRHQAILDAAMADKRKPSLGELLAQMPDVGEDSDWVFPRG